MGTGRGGFVFYFFSILWENQGHRDDTEAGSTEAGSTEEATVT